ncbi:MAG: hypothetical protein GW794_00860, partial [Flavobacteriales bacterium]|nr:hypothetical protein [Flavobacteriales bacterium]
MKRVRFQTRINIAFALLLFTLILGGFALYRMNNVNQHMETFYKHPFVVSNATGAVKEKVSRINHWVDHYVQSDIAVRDLFFNEIKHDDSLLFGAIQTIKTNYLGSAKDLDSLQTSYNAYKSFIFEVVDLQKKQDTLKATHLLEQFGLPKMNHLLAQADTISEFAQNNADTLYLNMVKSGKERFNFFWMVIVFLVGLSLFLAYALSISITTPINRFIKEIKGIYRGETVSEQHDLLKVG